jgi:glutamate racemase
MRWMITDSGMGGLSVCAGLERALSDIKTSDDIELLYVNATPEDKRGYNALKTQQERIALFDQFLQASAQRFQPDEIVIACNTLSVIYNETEFAGQTDIPVRGIVEAGVNLCEGQLKAHPDRDLIVFATETTTEAGTYPRLINAHGATIVAQECPELAHAISNDASGRAPARLLERYVDQALTRIRPETTEIFAFLGCTHYGYQAQLFKDILERRGYPTTPLNPNQDLVDQLVRSLGKDGDSVSPKLEVRFVSRYRIPEVEISSMKSYLSESAPLTMLALHGQEVMPDLFTLS